MTFWEKKLEEVHGKEAYYHVGATSMGTGDMWYAIHTGKMVDYDLERTKESEYSDNEKCLRLKNRDMKLNYEAVDCAEAYSRFICQKITDSKPLFIVKCFLF